MLDNLRILDLTDEKGFLAGKILAEMGADVVKLERPGGDFSRLIGPFLDDNRDPEKSLYWFAYNSSKRSITLDIQQKKGKDLFRRLVGKTDVVIESFIPGYMDGLDLGYKELEVLNRGLVMASISPFGATGPRRNQKASDISLMAMSGAMSVTGEADRAPLRFGLDQSYCLAATHAAIGILIALSARDSSGQGQHIDVSAMDALLLANFREIVTWEYENRVAQRSGDRIARGSGTTRQVWKCKDGYVTWVLLGGKVEMQIFKTFIDLMDEKGMAGILKSIDWDKMHVSRIPDAEIKLYEDIIAAFFLEHTKQELQDLSLKYNLRLCAINDVRDNATGETLASRNYWKEVAYPEFGLSLKSPGHLFLSNSSNTGLRRKAPRIGEHNNEIFIQELGLSMDEMKKLTDAGII